MAMHKKNGNHKNGGMKKLGKGGKSQMKNHQNGNGLTPAQKKLPPALQAAILKKKKKK